jgi:NitT/TauT family transport system substrate-binding protein
MKISRAQAAAALLGGTALGAPFAPGRAQAALTIHVINPPLEAAAEGLYAKDMGFFAKSGFDAQMQVMQAGVPAAVASNSFEFGWVTLDALATAHVKNIPLVAIAPAAEFTYAPAGRQDTGLVVSAASSIRGGKDLNGKLVAVPSRLGISESSTRAWIDQNGGDSTTVKMLEVPFIAMVAALDAGRVDAAYISEPFLSPAAKTARVIGNPRTAIGRHYLTSAWVTTSPYATGHPEVVSRFAAVIRETASWANQNPEKSGEIIAKYTKVELAVVATMVRSHFAEVLTPALMQPVIDISAKYNKFAPFPASELIYSGSR